MSEENLLTSNVNCSEWVWYEEWSPATIDGPAECIDAGWYCKNCFWSPNQELDLYFDNPEEKPKFNYCPNCGADMTIRHPIIEDRMDNYNNFIYAISNGILISCEKLFKDENARNHYKASFNFDVFNTETNEKYGKCTVSFPNLVSDCYLEDFLGLPIDLLDITAFAEIKNGFEEKVAIEVTMK